MREPVAVLLSKSMTCARPRRNATPSEHFLHTSQCTLHTPHFTLHTCTSHSTLHLISNHVSSSHLISPHLSSSHLMSSKPSSSQLFSSHPSTHQPFSSPRSSSQLNSAVLHARKLLLSERSLFHKNHWAQKAFAHRSLDTDAFTQKSLCKILCATKLAQGTSQYYVVLQSLQQARPRTTSYYKSCTKHFPVLQSLHQYYCALHRLHKHFLVHCAQFFYTSTSFYTQQAITQGHFYTDKLLHTEGFTHRKLYTQQVFTQRKLLHKESC